MKQIHDDEVNLFEFFKNLWDGKWLISVFLVFANLIGFGYVKMSEPLYEVSIPFTYNSYFYTSEQQRQQTELEIRFLNILANNWTVRGSRIVQLTTTPLKKSEYRKKADSINETLTKQIYDQVKSETVFMDNIIKPPLLNTEEIAKIYINAYRIINNIESGNSSLIFGKIVISKKSPKTSLIIIIFSMLGVMIGTICVFISKRNRKSENIR